MRKIFGCLVLAAAGWAQAQMTPIGLWQSIDDGNAQPKAEISIAQRPDGSLAGKVERSLLVNATTDPNCVLCTDDRKNQPKVALEKIAQAEEEAQRPDPFYLGKVQTARFYFTRLMPETSSLMRRIRAGSDVLLDTDAALA